jgi:PTH1 family peptidyl-tRNA hydrolase
MSGPWLIAGLGNPGSAYAGTRHNVGAMAVRALIAEHSARPSRHKRAFAEVAELRVGMPGVTHQVIAACPLSYMNESGGPVSALVGFYGVELNHLIVLHDELDIDFTTLRVKFSGGDNGHNGLKSIRSALGTGGFYRVRIGIGRPVGRQAPADFVLQPFTSAERSDLPQVLDRAARASVSVVEDGLEATQNTFNARE